jgi:type II secretory ATPase GspE/PulE/Tfp pilus assembly ATPase PilB-like protein
MATEEITPKEEMRIGEMLVKDEHITREQLEAAIKREKNSGISRVRHIINTYHVPIAVIDEIFHREFYSPKRRKEDLSLGETLLELGAVTKTQLRSALSEQKRTGRLLRNILLDRGVVTPPVITAALGKLYGLAVVEIDQVEVDLDALAKVPESVAWHNHLLPIRVENGVLVVAISDPRHVGALDTVHVLSGMKVECVLAEPNALLRAVVTHYRAFSRQAAKQQRVSREKAAAGVKQVSKKATGVGKEPETMGKRSKKEPASDAGGRFEELRKAADNMPVVSLVARIIEGAINARATDIHLDPQRPEMRVRYRIDGILHDVMTIPSRIEAAVVSRIKILADIDITETRRPQDGHFDVSSEEEGVDLRVATLPTHLGERVVLRLLNRTMMALGLNELGLDKKGATTFTRLIKDPFGMVLVTGPTGCGKTTTLYAALNQRNVISESIVTLEEPVEYELSGVNQIAIDANIGLTFPATLRAVLRQDPDTIMVGEIRDVETAHIAIRAAMTGHLVFSTLHTNTSAEAVGTLHNMGVPPYLTAASLIGVVAQRLVRIVCPHCKKRYKPTVAALKSIGIKESVKSLVRGTGCDECFHTGYLGRTGIFEILLITPGVRDLILANAPAGRIARAARVKSIPDQCRAKVKRGITTIEEYLRVIGPST